MNPKNAQRSDILPGKAPIDFSAAPHKNDQMWEIPTTDTPNGGTRKAPSNSSHRHSASYGVTQLTRALENSVCIITVLPHECQSWSGAPTKPQWEKTPENSVLLLLSRIKTVKSQKLIPPRVRLQRVKMAPHRSSTLATAWQKSSELLVSFTSTTLRSTTSTLYVMRQHQALYPANVLPT